MKKIKNNKKYKHLNQFDRDRIGAMLSAGHKQIQIAKVLDVDKSTISRELNRNKRKRKGLRGTKITNGKYDATLANHKSYVRRKYAKWQGKKIEDNQGLRDCIIQGLNNDWNPDEISGRMKLEHKSFYASKNSIYRWLYSVDGQNYCHCLSSKRTRCRKRKKKKQKRSLIPNRIGIESRSKNIDQEYSHYEGDTIVSGKKHHSKKSLAVIYEKKAKYVDVQKINNLKPNSFNKSLIEMKKVIKKIKSLTLDNGIENRYWEKLNIKNVYFCDPYSSWQKGGVENINKMIRKYIPKGSDIKKYSNEYITKMLYTLNSKPRKSLGYKTPYEIMIDNNLLSKQKLKEINILSIKNPKKKLHFGGELRFKVIIKLYIILKFLSNQICG